MFWLFEGRLKQQWGWVSHLEAHLANCNPFKPRGKTYQPSQFNPLRRREAREQRLMAPITVLRDAFVTTRPMN